ncbi:MAG: hypothetical protein IPM29_06505 [Planctomycetes bacterium]|nr:hypothetical protein [Planctomycetota bacterium]
MTVARSLGIVSLAFTVCVSLAAQAPEDGTGAPSTRPAPGAFDVPVRALESPAPQTADWLVPIHTGATDPVGGEYGVWASGPDYKVSFHDGFAFYPVLGAAYEHNLPIVWHTETVTSGGAPLDVTADAALRYDTWRAELSRGAVTERYDVRRDGVEQSFVVHRPPSVPGDLVVTGRIETELEAVPVQASHTDLTFCDEHGNAILRYGSAVAIDASGRSTAALTSYDGQRIELTVPGTWLRDAVWPVTIDPLTSAVVIASWGSSLGTPSYPDIVRNDDTNELYIAYSRLTSSGDYDSYVRVTADDFSGSTQLFTDVTTTWSTRYNQVAFVSGSDRWAVALGREFPTSSQAQVRVYVHDVGNTTLNSGTTLFLLPPAGQQDQTPSIGGTWGFASGTKAYMAFRRDTGTGSPNTNNSEVWGVLVDCGTVTPAVAPSLGTPVNLETSSLPDYDAEWPCVTQYSGGGTLSWIVVWQEYNNAITGDDWDVITQRVESDGSLAGRSFFGPASGTTHKVRPKVAGLNQRYAVSYVELTNNGKTGSPWGDSISVQRFNWSETSAVPSSQSPHYVAASTSNNLTTGDGNRSISYDDNTLSHWAVAFHSSAFDVYIVRTGYTGLVTESAVVYNTADSGFSPSITYNNDACEFQLVWATTETSPIGQPVYGALFQYRAASNLNYGTSCAGTITGDNIGICNAPYKGSEFYTISLSGGRASTPTVLFASIGQVDRPLPFAGNSACRLLLSTSIPLIDVVAGNSSSTGAFSTTFPIPESVADVSVYWQFIQVDSRLALWSSDALRTVIR